MKDRFYYGFFAGVIAGIPMVIFNLVSYYLLNLARIRYLNWAAVLIYGNFPLNAFDSILAQIVHFGFLGFAGIVFAHFIPLVTSRHYLFKGWVYSMGIFFLTYSVTLIYKVPGLQIIQPYTVLSNLISTSIFGLALAEVSNRIVSTKSIN
ncbi:hypothetical protein [Desulfosporosinus sp. Sb-LF]|uniref:hypothetical protein n=1 Tax=Desulfosporosinus sp. Sb-LF TaxID=2560027 RepID=UPI00107EF97D|nr:hypothetical protein [Desulfosporosinus sp. Sb-LF]TGE34461.1 hypothetical protein E4K68_01875 [Desulfosporosinus sp. Sb-LF]